MDGGEVVACGNMVVLDRDSSGRGVLIFWSVGVEVSVDACLTAFRKEERKVLRGVQMIRVEG